MIVMDVRLDNIYAFKNFHMNFSYPKKIVDSYIEDEYLQDHPNFRYKKAVVLMGANASGKTSLGRAFLKLFNLIERQEVQGIYSMVDDSTKIATFVMDIIIDEPIMYRVNGRIPRKKFENERPELALCVQTIAIGKNDSYEKCAERLNKQEIVYNENYIEELKKIPSIGWAFQLTENAFNEPRLHFGTNRRLHILETIMKVLDPSIKKIDKIEGVEDSFVIHLEHRKIIVQDGKIVNTDLLSAGTYRGIYVAEILAQIMEGENGFYYVDEKFSYVQSDVEKALLAVMADSLGRYDQLIFTTHNLDILDLPYPKHTFMFLKKEIQNKEMPITIINASDYLKRNTDSLRSAVDNDLFGITPNVDALFDLEKGKE